MTLAARVLHEAAIGGFVVLGSLSVRDWIRSRNRAHAAVATAFGALGILALAWFANDLTDYRSRTIAEVSVVAFLGSGYGLLSIRNALVPFTSPIRRYALAAMAGVAALHAAVHPPLGLHARYSVVQAAALWLLIAVWGGCAGEPIVTFWRVARGRPAVQRARLRALSVGTGALIGLLLAYARSAPKGSVAAGSSAVSLIAVLLLPIMWAAFSPPASLRRLWRVGEEEALRRALHDLFLEPRDRQALAARALEWAVRLIGADGGVVSAPDGEILASVGNAITMPIPPTTGGARLLQGKVPAIVAPLRTADGIGRLVVVGGRFAPVFGSDELARLEQWATAAGVALDRVGIVEELRSQTQKQDWMLQALSDLGEGVIIGSMKGIVYVNDAYCEMIGYSRAEMLSMRDLLDVVLEEDRMTAVTNARMRRSGLPAPARYDLRLVRKDERIVDVEVAVKPYEMGGEGHYIGVFRDITARKRAVEALRESQRRYRDVGEALVREAGFVRLLQDVAVAANQATGVDEALQMAIDAICDHTGWPIGHAYVPADDGRGGLLPTSIWHLSSPYAFARFRDITEKLWLPPGAGLPGRAMELGAPVWIEDAAADSDAPSLRFVAGIGVRSGFAFPVLVGSEVVAVLEFFSPEPVATDEQLLAVTAHIGSQLGRVVERARAKHTLEEREKQLQEAQTIAHVGSWEWDVASNTVTWSDELFRIYGLDPRSFSASFEGFLERVHPDDRVRARRLVEQGLAAGKPFTYDHRIVRPDGTVRTVHARGEVVVDAEGRPARMVGTGQDVTEQRVAEQTLRSALEREREALERLRRLDEMKSAILSAVSHELRTPLTVILGFAQTLQREGLALSARDRTDFLARITDNAEKLDRLLSDLLDLDRLDRGILEPRRRPTDLGALVTRIAEQSGLADRRRVTIEAAPLTISVDAPRVERIVENLFVNAARHTPEGSRVWIRLRSRPGGAELVVEDDGPGVLPDQRGVIFEPFRQGPSAPAHSPGVGIGLSLVSRFAEMHGGRAWVEAREGGGASFRVFLPDAPASLDRAAAERDFPVPDVKAG